MHQNCSESNPKLKISFSNLITNSVKNTLSPINLLEEIVGLLNDEGVVA